MRGMTRAATPRSPLLAPLAYLAALVLLLEEWFWDTGARIGAWLGAWPPLRALEARIRALPPYGALAAFVLPGLLLLPVKIVALYAIAHGHAVSGASVFVAAKLGGAAVVARLYVLTRPALLSLAWFARCHNWFVALKDGLIARLRATHVFRRGRHLARMLRRGARRLRRRLARATRSGGRQSSHGARVLRRYVALWRARRRKPTGTERP